MFSARNIALICFSLVLMTAAGASAAGRGAATMPLGVGAEKGQSASAHGKAAAKPRPPEKAPAPAGSKNSAAPANAGIKGFSPNPFSLSHKNQTGMRREPGGKRHHYGAKPAQVKSLTLDGQKKLSISAESAPPADDRLKPRRGVFPGASNTLSRMDAEPPPEVHVDYTMNGNATTRLTVNPQDEGSPLPRPAEQDGSLNAAGVYMKVDVAPDVQLKVGGEYCDINSPGGSAAGSSTGAAIGLKWDF